MTSYILLLALGCAKKGINTAKPEVEDLGDGASRLETVLFEGVQKIEEEDVKIDAAQQEASLDAVEQKDQAEDTSKPDPDTEEGGLKTIKEVEELITTFYDFVKYEYGEDDEANANYLLGEKLDVFHQLTGSAYKIVMAERNYYEVSAGIYVAGAAELRYAEMWKRYPTPGDLDHNAKIVFGEKVRDTVGHLGEEGKDKLERLISHYNRSGLSGEFTQAALQELQWRFPLEYPDPVLQDGEESNLLIFKSYSEFMEAEATEIASEWPEKFEERVPLERKLQDPQSLLDELGIACSDLSGKHPLMGAAAIDFCVLRGMGEYDVLYSRYQSDLPQKLASAQKVIQEEIQKTLDKIAAYPETEYHRFWSKELNILLREYQYAKVQALREKGRLGFVPALNLEPWEYKEEEEMSKEVADILDAHVQQLERISKIIRYDVHHLDDDRTKVTRQMFIDLPEELQELEYFAQATLFAFPENHEVRSRIMLTLGEAYAHYVYVLRKMEVSGPDGEKILEQAISVYQPISSGLLTMVSEGAPSEEHKVKAKEALDVLSGKYDEEAEEGDSGEEDTGGE